MELAVVVMVLGVLTMAVTPLFSRAISGLRGDRMLRDFVAAIHFTRERAIIEGTEFRFYIDERENTYWVERFYARGEDNEKVFAPFEYFGSPQYLGDEAEFSSVSAERNRGGEGEFITFYGSGASSPAKIRIRHEDGGYITIETEGRAGRLEIQDSRRGRRR